MQQVFSGVLHSFFAFLLFTSYIFSHHAHSFLSNACILLAVPSLTHSLFLGVVLSSVVNPPHPHTWSFSFRCVVYFAFLSLTTTLCPRKSFSFTRSSCTSVTLICSPSSTTGNSCWWQMSHNQLASLLLAPSLREAPDFFHICSLQQHFYKYAAKSPFPEVQLLRELQVPLHHEDWIPVETAWE